MNKVIILLFIVSLFLFGCKTACEEYEIDEYETILLVKEYKNNNTNSQCYNYCQRLEYCNNGIRKTLSDFRCYRECLE